jgi:outer membrane receptor protein involved in Fe transport
LVNIKKKLQTSEDFRVESLRGNHPMIFKEKTDLMRALLASTVIAGFGTVAAFNTAAVAQDQDDDTSIEEVVVTGTRIRNPNISSSSPVTVLTGAEIDSRGITRIEDLINTLPQAFAAQGANLANGGSGAATVDLRGLSADRTLVLVDGKRLPFGDPQDVAVDLNQIPAQLVERIDILTGGASAVYGSDALAGVVNFIMKRDFEGLQFDLQGGVFQSGNSNKAGLDALSRTSFDVPDSIIDGRILDINFIAGTGLGDGEGNVTAWFGFRDVNEITWGARAFSACAFGAGDPRFECVGSSTTSPARLTDFGLAAVSFDLLAFDPVTGGDARPIVLSGSPNDTYNFGPLNHLQRPDRRFTFGAMGHYEISNDVEFFFETSFTDDRTDNQIAPSGTFFATGTINCDHPFLTPNQFAAICTANGFTNNPGQTVFDANGVASGFDTATLYIGRRNVEGGGRKQIQRHTTFRAVGGFRGELGDAFTYEVFGQFANVIFAATALNDISIAKLAQALNVRIDPNTGNAACQGVIDGTGNPACVPYDIFSIGGTPSDAAINFIIEPAFDKGNIVQKVYGGTINGDLGTYGFTSPMAETGVQIVAGFEYREDQIDRSPDATSIAGGLTGTGGASPPIDAAVDLYEFYTEVAIPIVEGAEFADELTLTAAFRFSDFASTGGQSTFAGGLSWTPIPDIRFRAQFQRAVRSPNVLELFRAQGNNLFDLTDPDGDGIFDPCAGATPFYSAAQCANQGVTAAQYGSVADNPAGQFNLLIGGNPDLNVESSDTYTVGVIVTPSALPGLTLSVDYFDIKVEDFIGTVPPGLAIDKCALTGDPFFCSLIQRDAGGGLFVNGATSWVVNTNLNTGSLATSGIDVNAAYSVEVGEYGSLLMSFVGTYLLDLSTEALPGEVPFDCTGFYGASCGIPNPEWRHRFLATWETPWSFNLTTTWRYHGAVDLFPGGSAPTNLNAHFAAENFVDLQVSVDVKENARLRFGINNLLDNDPPLSSVVGTAPGNANTYPQVYDANGRFVFLGLTIDY